MPLGRLVNRCCSEGVGAKPQVWLWGGRACTIRWFLYNGYRPSLSRPHAIHVLHFLSTPVSWLFSGYLVADFLKQPRNAADYLSELQEKVDEYRPFSLLCIDQQ